MPTAKAGPTSSSPPLAPTSDAVDAMDETIKGTVEAGRNTERAVFETDRQLIVGDLTLPPAGYQSRFSDSLNRGELEFVPLTNVEVTALADGTVTRLPFLVVSKQHVRVAYPVEG